MKNLVIIIACLFFASAVSAQTAPENKFKASIIVCEKNPEKITVTVSNPLKEKITIDVYSSTEGYLLTKTIQDADYKTNLDFTTAEDGDYTVQVSCRNGEKFKKTVRMETRQVRSAQLK